MAYVPEWERLPDALKRVMAAGLTEDEAQVDICRAISDRKIALRFQITPSPYPMRVVDVSQVNAPIDLKPSDFDWEKSCLERTWRSRAVDIDILLSSEHAKYIELFRPDVTNVLIAGTSDSVSAGNGAQARGKTGFKTLADVQPERHAFVCVKLDRSTLGAAKHLAIELAPFAINERSVNPARLIARNVAKERDHGAHADALKFQLGMKPDHVAGNVIAQREAA